MEKVLIIKEKEYKIRKILPEDNLQIAEIVRYNLKNHNLDIPGTAYFDAELDKLSSFYSDSETRGYFVVVDKDDNVEGGIGFAEFSDINDCAELQKLYLSDKVKGFGLGYVLINFIEKKMSEAGFKLSYLETHENLKAAICIYEKSGYARIDKPKNVVHNTMTHFYLKTL
jgi:putative acetyltransferase